LVGHGRSFGRAALEFSQIFFVGRVASIYDIIGQVIGLGLGFLVVQATRGRFDREST
jgi:VanZ family protein